VNHCIGLFLAGLVKFNHFRYPEKYQAGMKNILAGLKGKKYRVLFHLEVKSSIPYFFVKAF